ncbi:hypothetical protein THRCLA_23428 [Thraustotheca clavata]|uniref:Uncharacterized protein n=1 Tax=Thraustotheca clavata TaxID=74557 RepID=A0A1V9Y5J3_9STRA|nr:hypothetical protein THRCLA_23428 [Thraustotheca clavata]
MLITAKANINQGNKVPDRNDIYNHVIVVSFLISAETNVDQKDKYQSTPVHYAAERGHKDVVPLLISTGANIHQRDKVFGNQNDTIFHVTHVMAMLISAGASINQCNEVLNDQMDILFLVQQHG